MGNSVRPYKDFEKNTPDLWWKPLAVSACTDASGCHNYFIILEIYSE